MENEDKVPGHSIDRPHREVLRVKPNPLAQDDYWYASPCKNILNNNRLLPLPSVPQMSESLPIGKLRVKSTNTNFFRGVDAADGVLLPRWERSCGQVTVADWRAIVWVWCESGGIIATSAPYRYFSIRRSETKLYKTGMLRQQNGFVLVQPTWSMLIRVSGRAFNANFISEKTGRKFIWSAFTMQRYED